MIYLVQTAYGYIKLYIQQQYMQGYLRSELDRILLDRY